jgi:hypothetical protein
VASEPASPDEPCEWTARQRQSHAASCVRIDPPQLRPEDFASTLACARLAICAHLRLIG